MTIITDEQIREALDGTAWRREPLNRRIAYARRRGIPVDGTPPEAVNAALERLLEGSDLLPAWWLAEGVRRADAVALVRTPEGPGTGFLVAPGLLLTNNHVLPDPDIARDSNARFRYQEDTGGNITGAKAYDFRPERFFVTSPTDELDYTVVAVEPSADGSPPGATYGVIPLIAATGKIMIGQPVNIIQHPRGDPREIAFRNNLLLTVDDATKVTYLTDTEPGSSGSPVFNDQWECVALHHSGVPARDSAGREVDVNGDPVTRFTPEELRRWVANEGIRVSAIVADITARTFPPDQKDLVDLLLAPVEDP
ncbi:trypsin-like serine peptidase [Cryptosporangium aurantiacum]|uniref:V8-like Glu-specific endopeptidase n=1 Tax=Cryptosporangium aurantiacum TaxID=134849 RepID=A0A1M7RBR5_9ACTN|nr:serine protease [Cryptosporangium aurantiacum]SHN43656.1 V8-like Glu-specific endopeptidase [Cryptosporangium aurantiacum]